MAKKSKTHNKTKTEVQAKLTRPAPTRLESLPLHQYYSQIKWALVALAAVYVLYVLWGLLSPYTWDDDCPNRYYHTLEAWTNPNHLISMWNRPLWVWLFFFPAKLGTFIVPIIMSFISVLAGYYCYKSAIKLDLKYPLLAGVFLLLQPYFMGVGRDAMTEPLAACIIVAGVYLYLSKRYLPFVLIGSLLPLARAELVILLGLWAVGLIIHKQWKYIPLLGLGVLLWSLLALVIKGDFFYILNETLFKETGENRYGNSEFTTYLSRYFYVIGPVVFYYFIIGLLASIKLKRIDLMVFTQFVVGFAIYTLFAWKINLGHSAAFLRNLIPLSPLVAIIALVGFNYLIDVIQTKEQRVLASVLAILPMVLTAVFFRNKIASHHKIVEMFDPFNLPIVLGLGLLTLALLYIPNKVKFASFGVKALAIVSPLLLMSHTLITEPPAMNSTAERIAIKRTSDILTQTSKMDRDIYCNHTFFYWAGAIDKTKEQFKVLNTKNLSDAKIGSIVIWETHYSNRLEGDVQLASLTTNRQDYLELYRVIDKKNSFQVYVFEKINSGANRLSLMNDFIAEVPGASEPIVRRAVQYVNENRVSDALEDLNFAISVDPENAMTYYEKGNLYQRVSNNEEALKWYDKAIEQNKKLIAAYTSKAIVFYQQAQYQESITQLNICVKESPGYGLAYYYLGLNYLALDQKQNACNNLSKAQQLGQQEAKDLIAKHCK